MTEGILAAAEGAWRSPAQPAQRGKGQPDPLGSESWRCPAPRRTQRLREVRLSSPAAREESCARELGRLPGTGHARGLNASPAATRCKQQNPVNLSIRLKGKQYFYLNCFKKITVAFIKLSFYQ